MIEAPAACTCCGSARIAKMGEDITETLEVIPRQWKVVQTVREKFTCRDCEKISQPPAPFHPTPRGWAGPNLLAMVLFGLYMVPRKVCGLRDFDFVLSMSVGAVVTTQAVQFAVHHGSLPPASVTGAWLAFSCGPIWALGILFYTLSVSQMGLALATPIKNTTAVLGTLIGLLVFSEWRQTSPFPAMVGSVLVVGCAVVLGRCGEQSEKRSCVTPLGVVYALLAAVFFAAYTIPLRLAQKDSVDSYELLALMGLGTPVALAFFATNIVCIFLFMGGSVGINQMVANFSEAVSIYALTPMPLFLIMGSLFFRSGLGENVFRAIDMCIGNLRARLAYLTVLSGAVFASLSGSSLANTGMMGSTMVPAMRMYDTVMTPGSGGVGSAPQMGFGSAIGVSLFLVIMVITVINLRVLRPVDTGGQQ